VEQCEQRYAEDPESKQEKKNIFAAVADSYSNGEEEIKDDTNVIVIQNMCKNKGTATKHL